MEKRSVCPFISRVHEIYDKCGDHCALYIDGKCAFRVIAEIHSNANSNDVEVARKDQ